MQRDLETRGSSSTSDRGLLCQPVAAEVVQLIPASGETIAEHSIQPDDTSLDNVLTIHEYERQRLAQELHDSAGQLVVALDLGLAHLRRVGKDADHDNLIAEIQDTVHRIDEEIRSLAFLRYPVELCDRSLYSALQSFALGFGRRTGIRTTFRWVGDRSAVDETLSLAVLRVAQEALANVHRHSGATSAKVTLKRDAGRLQMNIADDGVGFPPGGADGKPRGIGLQGMRHRIETVGGSFRTVNMKHGVKIAMSVPLPMAV